MIDKPKARSIRCDDITWGKLKILATARKEKLSITLAYLVASEWERLQSNNWEDKGKKIIWPMSQPESKKKKSLRQIL